MLQLKICLSFTFFCACLSLFHPAPAAATALVSLKAGVLKHFPPQYELDAQGKPGGFAVDTLEAIAAQSGIKLQYRFHDNWAELQQALNGGEIDLIPNMGIIPSRRERVSFSLPIETFPISLFVRRGSSDIAALDHFTNRPLGIVAGNVGASIAGRDSELKTKSYPQVTDAFYALLSGHVDGVIFPQPVFLKLARELRLEEHIRVAGPPLQEVKRGIGCAKGREAILAKLNPQIETFVKSPEYKAIYTKWYGKEPPYWNVKRVAIFSGLSIFLILIALTCWRHRSLKKLNKRLTARIEKQTLDLQEREYLFRNLLNNQQDAIFLQPFTRDGMSSFTEVNDKAVERYGYDREEFLRMTPIDLTGKEAAREHLPPEERNPLEQGHAVTFELNHISKKGVAIPVEITAKIITLHDTRYILSTARDISKRKQAEKKLRESEEKFRVAFRTSPDAVNLTRMDGAYVDVNESFLQFTGCTYAEVIGKNSLELQIWKHPEDRDRLIQGLKEKGFIENLEAEFKSGNGDIVHGLMSARLIEIDGEALILSMTRDITERKKAEQEKQKLEKQLRQKFKMEGIGVMAGGIAHNFNNNLAVILGNLEMAQRKLDRPAKVRHYLDTAKIALFRSRDLVSQILTYSRQGSREKQLLKLDVIIEETLQLLTSTLPSSARITYRKDRDANKLTITGDPGQVQEVLLNLCNNAVHAMQDRGNITIGLDKVELDEAHMSAEYKCAPGPYARLSVRDTGCGMDATILDRIFDPFFTTKGPHEGTGMGLSTVQGVVDQHGGLIKINSSPGAGSTFTLYFPLTRDAGMGTQQQPNPILPRGSENILYVDDDKMLAEINRELLEELGYRVTLEIDSLRAMRQFAARPGYFDLVISDLTMPGLTGTELLCEMRETRADVRTILCTGHNHKITAEEAAQLGIDACCTKPLNLSELAQKVRQVLDGKR